MTRLDRLKKIKAKTRELASEIRVIGLSKQGIAALNQDEAIMILGLLENCQDLIQWVDFAEKNDH